MLLRAQAATHDTLRVPLRVAIVVVIAFMDAARVSYPGMVMAVCSKNARKFDISSGSTCGIRRHILFMWPIIPETVVMPQVLFRANM